VFECGTNEKDVDVNRSMNDSLRDMKVRRSPLKQLEIIQENMSLSGSKAKPEDQT
jgi:hypothetical protein